MGFTPPADVRSNAKRGLELRQKYNRGGTAVGVARARDLSNGASLSLDTIKRMNSYFSRHEVDKKGEGWGKDSAGYIAWLLWGGDAGWSWAKGIIRDNEKKDKSTMAEFASSYAQIVKTNKNDDGTMTVYGKATDSSIDIDQQICDETWLKEAMPQWMVSGGNIREQHSSIAAGVATEYEAKADGHYITALVVDPVSVKKVETGVLKGFSIGIRGPRVIRDNKAAGGRIVDGQIVEISLVDRPANPNAKLMLAKAAESGELEAVKQITIPSPAVVANLVKFDPNQERDERGRFGSGGGGSDKPDATPSGHHDEARNVISNLEGRIASAGLDKETEREAKAFLDGARDRLEQSEKFRAEGNSKGAVLTMNQASERVLAAEQLINGKTEFGNLANGDRVIYGNDQRGTAGSPNAEAIARIASSFAESSKSTDADLVKFDPDQERDERGRFGSGGGDSGSSTRGGGDKEVLRSYIGDGTKGLVENTQRELADVRSTVDSLSEQVGREEDVRNLENASEHLEIARYLIEEGKNQLADGDASGYGKLDESLYQLQSAAAYMDKVQDNRVGDLVRETYTQTLAFTGRLDRHLEAVVNDKSATTDSKVEPMTTLNKFDPDQERDENGRFGSGGGGSSKPSGDGKPLNYNLDENVINAIQTNLEDGNEELGYVFDAVEGTDDEDIVSDIGTAIDTATDAMALDDHPRAEAALNEAVDLLTSNRDRIDGLDIVLDEIDSALTSLINNKAVGSTLTKADRTAKRAKALVGSLIKFDQKRYDQACVALAALVAVEANEMKAGSEEVKSIELLLSSIKALKEWYEGEVAEGEVPGGSLQPENEIEEIYMAAESDKPAPGKEDEETMCPDCELEKAECKCADKAAELDVDDAVVSAIIDKAVATAKASVVEEIDLLKSALEVERSKAIQLEGELETAKKAVAPTGPKRSANAPAIDTNALLLKAAEYNQKAKVTTDPTLAKGYRELAKDLLATSKQGE